MGRGCSHFKRCAEPARPDRRPRRQHHRRLRARSRRRLIPRCSSRKIDAAGLPFTVVNAGVSGDTTAGGLRRIDWALGPRRGRADRRARRQRRPARHLAEADRGESRRDHPARAGEVPGDQGHRRRDGDAGEHGRRFRRTVSRRFPASRRRPAARRWCRFSSKASAASRNSISPT